MRAVGAEWNAPSAAAEVTAAAEWSEAVRSAAVRSAATAAAAAAFSSAGVVACIPAGRRSRRSRRRWQISAGPEAAGTRGGCSVAAA